MDKINGFNSRKNGGFSLIEVVISLTLLIVVFTMTITSVLAISSAYKRADDNMFFVSEITGFLECYKIGGAEEFANNVNNFIFDDDSEEKIDTGDISSSSYRLIVRYGVDYAVSGVFVEEIGEGLPQGSTTKEGYFISIIIDGGFFATACDYSGKRLFAMEKVYYSRYDI